MGIPLVALGVKPPQINDFATTQNNALVNQGLKNQNALAPGQQQIQQQTIQENENKLKQQQIAMQDQQTVQQILSQTGGNVEQALPQLQGKISPGTFQTLLKANDEHKKTIAEVNEKDLAVQKDHADRLIQIGQSASQMPDEDYLNNWPKIADAANAIKPELKLDPNNPLPKQQLQSSMLGLQVQSHYIAQEAEKRAQQKESRETEEFEAKKAKGLLGGQANEGMLKMNDWLAKNPGKGPSDYEIAMKKVTPAFNFSLNQNAGGGLSDTAKDQAAEKYYATGQLPTNMGRGAAGAAVSRSIMNRAAELHPEGNLAANSAEYKANAASLTKLQSQFDAVSAFEGTAIKNLNRLVETAKSIPDLGSKFANTPIRMINANMIGTEAMSKLQADLLTARSESARVLNSANATGVLTNEARKEAEDVLNGNLPFGAMKAAADELKNDMGNRHKSYADQIADIKKRLGGKPAETPPQEQGQEHPFFSKFGGKAKPQ